MKKYYIINEDFFDSVNVEDSEELTKEEIRASYENNFIFYNYIPFNKKTVGRNNIDVIPLVRIIKQFFFIIETLRFVGEYNVKMFFVGVDLLKTHKKEVIIEIDNDRITEKDYLKNIYYKLCDIYDRIEEFKGIMNISLTIHMTFEAVPVSSTKFFNDFRTLERYFMSVSKLEYLCSHSVKVPHMIFYKSGMKSEEHWVCRVGFSNKCKPSEIWGLATKIFGTDNKYYNTEEKNKLFSTDKSNSKYHLLLQSFCPNFLKKMALYFKRNREHYLCDIIGYDHDYDGHLEVVVYLDNKDYDNITVKNIIDYMKEMFDKFNIYDYSELKVIGDVLNIYVICDKLPEKKLGEKFINQLLEQYDFSVNMRIDDNDSIRFIKNAVINPAIENFKKFKDEISKIK